MVGLSRLRRTILDALRSADDWIFESAGCRQRVLFVFPDAYGWACQAPVAAQLLERGGVQVRALWDQHNASGAPQAFCSAFDERLYRQLSIEQGAASLAKWHIVVDSHLCSFYPKRRALRAYLHHGAGFGSGGGVAAAEQCDVYLGLSEPERHFLEQRRPGIFDRHHAFFPVGFPKADALVDGSFDRQAILTRLGLPDRRTVLITSHYTPTGTLRALGASLFARIAAAFPDFNVIQTGHPWLWQSDIKELQAWRQQWLGELQQVLAKHGNARLVTDMLAEPLAAASDLLVADANSSALTIFGLLDRPIACYADPEGRRKGKPSADYFYAASHVFERLEDAVDVCHVALGRAEERAQGRRVLRETFYPYAGQSAQRTAVLLGEIGAVCSSRSRHWPRVMALAQTYRSPAGDPL